MTTDRATIGAQYAAIVGYNPFEDDPTMSTEEGAQLLAGAIALEREYQTWRLHMKITAKGL